jgi:lipoate-protein ligase A
MWCINSTVHDPYFNLASEEYLLKTMTEDIFLMYRNQPTIVVGKHQNTLAEINLSYVLEKGIKVARRISGGGTVYHDMGNLNFAFITTGEEGKLVDYQRYTLPIIQAMRSLGVNASLGPRNEILVGKLKISGTASHVYKQRVLHHGTLLFDAEMEHLTAALKVRQGKFRDRAVRSVPSRVTNIRDRLKERMEVDEFQGKIFRYILEAMEQASPHTYSMEDLREIKGLAQRKYATWEWNYGYSPRYEYRRSIPCDTGTVQLQMHVEKGIIRGVNLAGDFMSTKQVSALEEMLIGAIHDPETLRIRLSGVQVEDFITGLDNEALLSGMF